MVLVLTEACLFVSVQVLSALDILQPPQIDCFEEMYLFMTFCLCVRKHLITDHSRTPSPAVSVRGFLVNFLTPSVPVSVPPRPPFVCLIWPLL